MHAARVRSGETSQSVVDTLTRRAPRLLGASFESFEELCEELARQSAEVARDELAAFCALELAWLDLGGQVFHRSAGEPLGPVCTPRVEYSGIVSASGTAEAVKTCKSIRELGVSRVKVKVGGDRAEDLDVLAAVRDVLGADAGVRVDANAAWDAETALSRLRDFERFRLEACEQPCAADDFEGMAWLSARSPIPVIADESLVSFEDARRLDRDARVSRVQRAHLEVRRTPSEPCASAISRARPGSTRCSEPRRRDRDPRRRRPPLCRSHARTERFAEGSYGKAPAASRRQRRDGSRRRAERVPAISRARSRPRRRSRSRVAVRRLEHRSSPRERSRRSHGSRTLPSSLYRVAGLGHDLRRRPPSDALDRKALAAESFAPQEQGIALVQVVRDVLAEERVVPVESRSHQKRIVFRKRIMPRPRTVRAMPPGVPSAITSPSSSLVASGIDCQRSFGDRARHARSAGCATTCGPARRPLRSHASTAAGRAISLRDHPGWDTRARSLGPYERAQMSAYSGIAGFVGVWPRSRTDRP
jgi:hypothetical protein